jgi:hypothetical protein
MLERLVDTPVRGLVYEAAGSADRRQLAAGGGLVRAASRRWMMPAAVVDADPGEHPAWLSAMCAGVAQVLAA